MYSLLRCGRALLLCAALAGPQAASSLRAQTLDTTTNRSASGGQTPADSPAKPPTTPAVTTTTVSPAPAPTVTDATAAATPAATTTTVTPPVQTAVVPVPTITRVYDVGRPGSVTKFVLGGTITLRVENLAQRLAADNALLGTQPGAPVLTNDSLVLFIGAVPLPNLSPIRVDTIDDHTSNVTFTLDRNPRNQRYWEILYTSPTDYSYKGKIGIGYRTRMLSSPYPLKDATLELVRLKPYQFWLTMGFMALLGGSILVLGRRSWMLRDDVDPARFTPGPDTPGLDPPYSLSKAQLAWWTFLIVGGYLLIYVVTGEPATVTQTTLALLGLSAGTTLVSKFIDAGGSPAVAAVAPQPVGPLRSSQNWLIDILSDERGVSLHRLQQVAFTLVAGYFFVRSVWKKLELPEWDSQQLLLLLISSATYLGLKAKEQPAPATDLAGGTNGGGTNGGGATGGSNAGGGALGGGNAGGISGTDTNAQVATNSVDTTPSLTPGASTGTADPNAGS